MSTEAQGFKLEIEDDYIHLETWGVPTEKNVSDPVKAALDLAEKEHKHKLLDDIRNVDGDSISLMVQAKGIGVLWRLRKFKKVAIVMKGEEMNWMFASSLQELRFGMERRIKGFADLESAKEWLKKPSGKA